MESDEEMDQFVVEPYLFEPVRSICKVYNEYSSSDESEEEKTDEAESDSNRVGNAEWCKCGSCVPFPTAIESKCCFEYEFLRERCASKQVRCIVHHRGFESISLDPDALTVSFYEFLETNGPIGDEEPIHEVYRYIAYRRLARWIWHKLRKHERRPLPACAVHAIRKQFPSSNGQYTGFRYADRDL